jgi:hypothetical protein
MPARLMRSAKYSPMGARDFAGETEPARDDAEAVLLREFLHSDSVNALARSLAARIADGTSPEEFIAAAESSGACRLGASRSN